MRRNLYQERLEAGLCKKCGKPKEGTTKLCRSCADKHIIAKTKYETRHTAQGLCKKCNEPIYYGRLCRFHYETLKKHTRDYKRRQVEKGFCFSCNKPLPDGYLINCPWCRADRKDRAWK